MLFIPLEGTSGISFPQAGDVLLVPAVALGNVGQLAIDLLINTHLHAQPQRAADGPAAKEDGRLRRVGFLRSRNVLPMVGVNPVDPVGSGLGGHVCTSLEVYRCGPPATGATSVTLVQARAPVGEGHMKAFAEELTAWATDVGFTQVIMLGAADSAVVIPGEDELLAQQFRFVATPTAAALAETIARLGIRRLAGDEAGESVDTNTGRFPLTKAGLLNPFSAACEARGVPMAALVFFTKEGANIPEACMMAGAANAVVKLFSTPPQKWEPPRAWDLMDGAMPETALFQ